MRRIAGIGPVLAPIILTAALAGCRNARVPLPEFPQLTQARELGEFGTARLRDSTTCRGETTSVETLVACMDTRGWSFVRRGGAYPSAVCWEVREANDPRRLPDPMCFERAPGRTTIEAGPSPANGPAGSGGPR
jgi:hypothetical protein